MNIATRIDGERGCGWRKAGGMYLVTGSFFTGCERMPLQLDRCPTCDHGVKPSRGWTWVDGDALFAEKPCLNGDLKHCMGCMLCRPMHRARPCPACDHDTQHNHESVYCSEECNCDRTDVEGFLPYGLGRVGLLWVGEKYYPKASDFAEEAAKLGISRRLHQIPREFVVGETVVLMAHRKAINEDTPGIFMVTRPTSIEYVVKGDETEKQLEALVKRGITPVQVKRLERQTSMFDGDAVATDYDLGRKDP